MARSLAFKLTFAFLVVSLSGIVLVAILAGQATASEFGYFMVSQNQATLVAQLENYYRARGSWDGADAAISPAGMMGMENEPMHGTIMSSGFAVADVEGRVAVAGAGHGLGEQLSGQELAQGTRLRVNGKLVGTLIARRNAFAMMTSAGEEFLARVNRALLLGAFGAGAMALILGELLTRALTRPLRELTAAAHGIAQGRLEQKVRVASRDELGELAEAFNQMSADLAHARDARRQMTADIAHDLRTPLSVILGHAEALRDGVLPPTTETFGLIHDEARRLSRLVEDLRTLSLAEAGELTLKRRHVQPRTLLERMLAAQAPRAQQQQITLQIEIEADLPHIEVDPDRMAQVLDNLLDNALRYTPAGGSVTLAARRSPTGHGVRLSVRDTGPGVATEDLPHIFDRFYRADKSRARPPRPDQGGSGLGLAIAKSIVEGHGGRIWAQSQPGEGATISIELPRTED